MIVELRCPGVKADNELSIADQSFSLIDAVEVKVTIGLTLKWYPMMLL